MSGKITLRAARLADAAAIARVHVETWRVTYAGLVPDTYLVQMTESKQAQMWNRVIRGASGPETVMVAASKDVPGGRIVGFGSCGRARDRPGTGEVFTLYVGPDWQGRGIGRELLERLFAELRLAGLNQAIIWVLGENPSRFFYEAMGGRRVAEQSKPFAGVDLKEIAYAWPDLDAWSAERSTRA